MSFHASTLWLIPARGGSKGIPDKNIKPFCGESLTSRAIKLAKELAGDDDLIYVSTDSLRIKEEAENLGVYIPFMRPEILASDSASTYSVILDTLLKFKDKGIEFEKVVLLQPTSPFRERKDIEDALKLWRRDIDMVVSVVKASENPYYNLFEENKEGFLKISKGEGNFTRRQDAPVVWEYNGAIYIMSATSLLKGPMSEFKKILPYEMPAWKSIDLDTPDDWDIAEILFERRR